MLIVTYVTIITKNIKLYLINTHNNSNMKMYRFMIIKQIGFG